MEWKLFRSGPPPPSAATPRVAAVALGCLIGYMALAVMLLLPDVASGAFTTLLVAYPAVVMGLSWCHFAWVASVVDQVQAEPPEPRTDGGLGLSVPYPSRARYPDAESVRTLPLRLPFLPMFFGLMMTLSVRPQLGRWPSLGLMLWWMTAFAIIRFAYPRLLAWRRGSAVKLR